jgi:type IV secretory pathway VirB10-like protein
VPSVRRHLTRAAVLVACLALVLTAFAGCATTQETAERKQAESKRILAARKHRQQAKKHDQKTHDHGSKKR